MVCLTIDGFLDLMKCTSILFSQVCLPTADNWIIVPHSSSLPVRELDIRVFAM